jgi:hypothetical protein
MIKFEIYYNKTYKNSCNLIKEIKKGYYLYIDQVNKILLIDNVKIAELKEINQIKFLVNGYYQVINIAEPNTTIQGTDIEYRKESEVK